MTSSHTSAPCTVCSDVTGAHLASAVALIEQTQCVIFGLSEEFGQTVHISEHVTMVGSGISTTWTQVYGEVTHIPSWGCSLIFISFVCGFSMSVIAWSMIYTRDAFLYVCVLCDVTFANHDVTLLLRQTTQSQRTPCCEFGRFFWKVPELSKTAVNLR